MKKGRSLSVIVTVWISRVEFPHKSVAKKRRSKISSSGQFVGGSELNVVRVMSSSAVQLSVAEAGGYTRSLPQGKITSAGNAMVGGVRSCT